MANGEDLKNVKVPADPAMQQEAEDPNLIRVYGVGEFNVMFEASPAAAAELVAELHKRGITAQQLPEAPAETEQ